jgi:hypothetical protein
LKRGQVGSILGFLSFGIKPDAQLNAIADLLAYGVNMDIPGNLSAWQQ